MNHSYQISTRQRFRNFLDNRESFATTLITILIELYGTEALSWSPQAIRMELEDDFAVKLPVVNFDKLMAAITLLTSNCFYKSLPDFIEICNILSNNPSTAGEFSPADTFECAWGITEALLLAPPDEKDDNPFSDEITAYIGYIVREEGILNPPDVLRIGTRDDVELKKVQYGFSDDPIMFNNIWSAEKAKTDEINTMIKRQLREMVEQLKNLPLETGSTENLVKRMFTTLSWETAKNSVL